MKFTLLYMIDNSGNHRVHVLLAEIPVPVTDSGLPLALGGRGAPFGIALGSLVAWLTSGGVMGCGFWLATKFDVMLLKSFTSTREKE